MKQLGKIITAKFCISGYMVGFDFGLSVSGFYFEKFLGAFIDCPKETVNWTTEIRNIALGEAMFQVAILMREAGVIGLDGLKNRPIEAELGDDQFGKTLLSWRILQKQTRKERRMKRGMKRC